MKKIFTSLLFLLSFGLFSQTTIVKSIDSYELGTDRKIKIQLPIGYDKDSITNYPLAIVLDDHIFDLYTGNAKYFAAKDKAPEQIVVCINTKKTRNKDAGFNKDTGKLTEDAKKFLRFTRDEALPFIEANYRTSPFITIVGEGITANLITHYLKEKTPIFNAYICLNPTLNIDIVNQLMSYRLKRYERIDNTFYFYMSSGNFNSTGKQEKITNLGAYLTSLEIKNLNTKVDTLESSPSNISSISEAIPRAMSKVFEIYSGITKKEFDEKIKSLSPLDAIAYLENKYLEIDFLFGANIGIRESDIFAIESIIIEKENGDYLRNFGEMILGIYPDSPLGDYYLGRYYETGKQFKKALRHYRIGYGKMDPSDPNSDKFYENVERVLGQD